MSRRRRIRYVSAEDVRAALWFWPTVAAVVMVPVAAALSVVRGGTETAWAQVVWPGDAGSASTVLQVVATSLMTATTLTFSLTVVAIQLASQQFSPRVLREFARDPLTQGVLSLFVSTFVLALVGLRSVDAERGVPVLVVALALLLGVASAIGLLLFVGHIVRALRVDTMMVAVHKETASTIREVYPEYEDRRAEATDPPPPADEARLILAARSGFVRMIDVAAILAAAREADAFVMLMVRPGDHIVSGTPLGRVWGDPDHPRTGAGRVDREVQDAVELGFERTLEQDASLGLRQLTDIAVKAISPGINDPVTATHAIGYCADLILQLQGRRLGPQQHADEAGAVRLVTVDRDHRYYLDLVCSPLRRFGAAQPIVLSALLRLLRDCATGARDDRQRGELLRQADLVLEDMSAELVDSDQEAVRSLAHRVTAAVEGRIGEAYDDESGGTRSV